jgi:hypothetical protein
MTMRRIVQWFWRRYPDDQLAFLARKAIAEDPRLLDVTRVSITCVKGVLRLTGRVRSNREKEQMEADIRATLQEAGLPYQRILNHLYVR